GGQRPDHKVCGLARWGRLNQRCSARTDRLDELANNGGLVRSCAPGPKETPMSRAAQDSSWHLLAFVLVVAGLSVLAPLTWRQARPPPKATPLAGRREARPQRNPIALDDRPSNSDGELIAASPTIQPQVAPLGPLVADQIDLDPSVLETPALPAP